MTGLSIPPRICIHCGATFYCKAKKRRVAFSKRKYCSFECYQASRAAPEPKPKKCPQCGKVFNIKPGQPRSVFAARRFCSISCGVKYRYRDNHRTRICEYCGKEFRVTIGTLNARAARFCSNECNTKNNIGSTASPESRRKVSAALLGRPKSLEHRLNISRGKKGKPKSPQHRHNLSLAAIERFKDPEELRKLRAYAIKGRVKAQAALARKGHTGTSIEIALRSELDNRNIEYSTNVPIGDIGIPDITFTRQRVLVEADGDYWHNLPNAKKRDIRQNAAYTELGYEVLRFWGSEIRESPEQCVDKIVKALNARALQ